jgi:hypothetical protein
MVELGYTWEWLPNEALRATSPVLSAVRIAPGTQKKVSHDSTTTMGRPTRRRRRREETGWDLQAGGGKGDATN